MTSSDLQRLREQLRRKVSSACWSAASDSGKHAPPEANGTWTDIDYSSRARTEWSPSLHLSRTQALVEDAVARGNKPHIERALTALAWWIEHDPRSDNWWHNQIGTPRVLASALLLAADHAPPSLIRASRPILERAGSFVLNDDGSRSPMKWTGANLLWISANQLLTGAVVGDETLVEHAISAALTVIRISTRHEEGIQVDGSFHQHGPLLYNGGYGASFLNECLFFFEATHGTRWAPDHRYDALLADYILNGTRWMLRGADYNQACLDRVITRARTPNESLAAVTAFLARVGGPRQAELEDLTQAIRSHHAPGNLAGNRMFYRSDFMVQQDPAACVSVRMHSRRTVRAECCNDEGKRAHHVSDGLTCLLRTGAEYRDIFPVWDWQKLPGITCVQTPRPESRHTVKLPASADSVGGVSDGTRGACTQHVLSDHLEARKSWFFESHGVLCLGAGIRSSFAGPVVTALDQSLIQGAVETDSAPAPWPHGRQTLKQSRWLRHGSWGFVFPQPTDVTLELGPKTGAWAMIGTGPSAPVRQDVFLAYLSHGEAPDDATYAYLIVADAGRASLDRMTAQPGFQIVANNEAIQAVWWPEERLLQAAFFSAGAISWMPGHSLRVDRDCILMLRHDASGAWIFDAADPRQTTDPVNVILSEPLRGERAQAITFPGGDHLGRTIRARL